MIAAVLVPLGAWLALDRRTHASRPRRVSERRIGLLALVVGVIGGIYGIGGGSILAPVLVGLGYAMLGVG